MNRNRPGEGNFYPVRDNISANCVQVITIPVLWCVCALVCTDVLCGVQTGATTVIGEQPAQEKKSRGRPPKKRAETMVSTVSKRRNDGCDKGGDKGEGASAGGEGGGKASGGGGGGGDPRKKAAHRNGDGGVAEKRGDGGGGGGSGQASRSGSLGRNAGGAHSNAANSSDPRTIDSETRSRSRGKGQSQCF